MEVSGFLNYPNIIMVGDINFTLLEARIWEFSIRSDRLGFFFSQLLLPHGLLDVL